MSATPSLAPPFPIAVVIKQKNPAHFAVFPVRDTFYKPEDFPEPIRRRFKQAKFCSHSGEAKAEAEAMVAWLRAYGINSTILRVREA